MNYQELFFARRKQPTWIVLPLLILFTSLWAYGQREPSQGARQHYKKGVELLEKQQLEEAIAELSSATKLNPKLVDAYNALGIALARKGEIKAAGEAFRKAIQVDPNLYEAQLGLASVLQQIFFLMIRRPPRYTLFPYTPLFQ